MRSKLFHLFDYQKFAQNKELQEVIDETAAEGGKIRRIPLSDEALTYAAAGVSTESGVSGSGKQGTRHSVQMMTVTCQFCPTSFEADVQKPSAVCPVCHRLNTFSG